MTKLVDTNTNNIRERILLGALLHDIGKFYQRADKKFNDKYNELSNYSQKIAEDICPVNENGRFGYQHVIWTNEFFERFGNKILEIPNFKDNLYYESNTDNVVSLACNHHKPQTLLQSFITIGDWWSAGIDRMKADSVEPVKYKVDWGIKRYKTIPLYSIFNSVKVNGKESEENNFAYCLKELSVKEKDIFPKKIDSVNDGITEEEYKVLWGKFTSEFEKLPTDTFEAFIDSLHYLLKKYTWSIPSNTMDMANVSLFEHLKTTSAFADSIYSYYTEGNEAKFQFNEQTNRIKLKDDVFPVIILGGDVSGIQDFIYNVASQKAAISLKGRSFYIQLLVDSIIQRIISHNQINASLNHVLYSSGGKFYMILPNTNKVSQAINELKKDIEKELWQEHKGKLSVNIDFVSFAFNNTSDKNKSITVKDFKESISVGDLWNVLAGKLHKQKNKKFSSLLNYDFFNIENVGGKVNTCAVTGEEESINQLKVVDKEFEEISNSNNKAENIYISESVRKQTKLGKVLKDVDYLIVHKDKDKHKYLSNRSKTNIKVTGVFNYLFNKKELTFEDAEFRNINSFDVSKVLRFNNTDFLGAEFKGNSVSYGFSFYGGNHQATTYERNKTFEELTFNNGKDSYLGVLRMDVDGLGNIFIKGLDNTQKSFSAYTTMSFQLDLFFSGYLNTIRNSEKFKDFVSIIYSGGDDVFAVGKWDMIIEFAEEIKTDFKKFFGNENMSISAGIAIVRNKFPIAKAAKIAEEAENKSKKFNENQKNAFTFLGETVSWEAEYDFVKKYRDVFIRLIYKEKMSSSILHKIIQFNEIKKKNEDLSYKWNTAYYLSRFADRYKNNSTEIFNFIEELKIELFKESNSYGKIALAARWAELIHRNME